MKWKLLVGFLLETHTACRRIFMFVGAIATRSPMTKVRLLETHTDGLGCAMCSMTAYPCPYWAIPVISGTHPSGPASKFTRHHFNPFTTVPSSILPSWPIGCVPLLPDDPFAAERTLMSVGSVPNSLLSPSMGLKKRFSPLR